MADQSSKFTIIFGVNTATALNGLKRFGSQAALALTAVTAALTAITKGAIDSADEVGKAAQKIGVAVRELSGLVYAGKLADATLDDLQTGFKGLNKAIASNSEALDRLGISNRNADGSLRSSYEVLLDIADAFEDAKDGAGKSAIAVELLGKSGANLIPLLNQGRKGIEAQVKEGEKLGVVFGEQLAKQAEEFNDNLTRMKAGLEGIGMSLANTVLPQLNLLIEKLSELKDKYGGAGVSAIDSTLEALGLSELVNRGLANAGYGVSKRTAPPGKYLSKYGTPIYPDGAAPSAQSAQQDKKEIADLITERERLKQELNYLEQQREFGLAVGGKSPEFMRNQEISYLDSKNKILKQIKDTYGQPPFGAVPFNPADISKMPRAAAEYNNNVMPIDTEMGIAERRKKELEKQGSFSGRFKQSFTAIANDAGDLSARGAETAIGAITTGMEGLGDAITGVITGAKNWAQVWQGVTTQIISMVVQMIIKFTILQGLMRIFGFAAAGPAGSVAAGAVSSVSENFIGPILPTQKRAIGGTMLPRGMYRVGEKGTEYAVTSRTLSRLGVGHFQALESGMNPGGKGGGSAPIIIVDSRAKANAVNESMGLRGIIREIMSEGIPAV